MICHWRSLWCPRKVETNRTPKETTMAINAWSCLVSWWRFFSRINLSSWIKNSKSKPIFSCPSGISLQLRAPKIWCRGLAHDSPEFYNICGCLSAKSCRQTESLCQITLGYPCTCHSIMFLAYACCIFVWSSSWVASWPFPFTIWRLGPLSSTNFAPKVSWYSGVVAGPLKANACHGQCNFHGKLEHQAFSNWPSRCLPGTSRVQCRWTMIQIWCICIRPRILWF